MKVAYFDLQYGAAGDMLNAALLDAGLDQSKWLHELTKIALPAGSFVVKISDAMRCGILCKKVDVVDDAGRKFDRLYEQSIGEHGHEHAHEHGHEHAHEHGHEHAHEHTHEHAHEHRHDHAHDHAHEHTHGHEHSSGSASDSHTHRHEHSHDHPHDHAHDQSHEHRHLPDILDLIQRSGISAKAKELASRIFVRLANAEAKVHGVPPAAVHFHEVGAVDAIVDIVGFAVGYCLLGIEKSYCSAVAIGSGKVLTEHGFFPVPGPATMHLLTQVGAATSLSKIGFECLTPTGAAILCEIAELWNVQPAFERVIGSGYGAGSKDPADYPNICRVLLGEQELQEICSDDFERETVTVIEANLDDCTPQTLSFTMERLLKAGALDVMVVAAVMKKGRSGHVLTVLSRLADTARLQELILAETSTIGLRWHTVQRLVADRQWQDVTLRWGGSVRIKVAKDNAGHVINAQPEYDDCAIYANKHNLPLKDVLLEALTRFQANVSG